VDVCLVTKLQPPIPKWWQEQVARFLPLSRLIVSRSNPLGQARQQCIEKVNTEWFLFLDDDVLIDSNFWPMLTRHLNDDVGAISGRESITGFGERWDRDLNKIRQSAGIQDLKLGERGTTVCCLVRTDLVKDWKPIPADLSAFEDYSLTQHVLRKGFRWLIVPTPSVLHLTWNWLVVPSKCFWCGDGIKKTHAPRDRIRLLKRYVLSLVYFFRIFLKRKISFRGLVYAVYSNLWMILGIVFA